MEPNKDRLRLWVKWLRDPAHKQGVNGLKSGEKYCCLGGACEVYLAETGKGKWDSRRDEGYQFELFDSGGTGDFIESDATMPSPVHEWFGLDNDDPMLDTFGYLDRAKVAASGLNDDHNWGFNKIADAIERTYEL